MANDEKWSLTVQDQASRTDYHEWRMRLHADRGLRLLVQDIDQVEYTITPSGPKPVGLVELSQADGPLRTVEGYLRAVAKNRRGQMEVVAGIARALEIPAYYLMTEPKLTRMWMLVLYHPCQVATDEWTAVTLEEWAAKLVELRGGEQHHAH